MHDLKSDLVGRTAELDRIDALLDGDSAARPTLLLRGDRGVGKTELLDATAARATARGMRVLRAFGAEFEAGLNFTTLHQLLYPLRHRVDRFTGGQPRARSSTRSGRTGRTSSSWPG